MPKGTPHINESSSRIITQRDLAFQGALARSTGWGFLWTGEPRAAGISTAPGTKYPIRVDVPLAPSLGSGGFEKQNARTLAKRRDGDGDDE
jgi:hypothetical protein